MINSGDTAWVLAASALVMLMTLPGVALFYGGLVRRKNILSMLMMSLICLCIVSLQWVFIGYSLSFAPDHHHLIGGLNWVGLQGVGAEPNPDYAATIPHTLYMTFQMMFAVITPALISGALAERMKFSAFTFFILLWTTFVYDPIAHAVWGNGGWLKDLGILDFAGGTVVHISSGVTGLVAALYIGRRRGYGISPMRPHHLPLTFVGAALLWFGWFGFNAGSALAANGLAVSAFIATNTATAAAALTWMAIDWKIAGKPTLLGGLTGALAGLVAITPASGFVTPISSIWIGVAAGAVCYFAIATLKYRFQYDDSLDAFGVHGAGGVVGALLTGVFADSFINPAGSPGLLSGNPTQLLIQAAGIVLVILYVSVVSYLLLKVVDFVFGVRVTENEELLGLDLAQHKESAYTLID